MKFLRLLLPILLLFVFPGVGRCASEDQVTAQIRAFFQWYVPLLESGQDREILKDHRKEMSRYISANRLAKIARLKPDSQEGDYFVGSLDNDSEWAKNIAVSHVKTDAKGRATAEVLLSGGTAANVHAKVTLVLEGGTYKIDAVESLPDFSGMATAQIRAFYVQYLHYLAHAIGDEIPMSHQDVRDGFTKEGLVRATTKDAASAKTDYLLQSTDWDPAWEERISVKPAEITPDGTRGTVEILLTGEKIPKAHLKVSLKHEKDTFKIDGVEKIND